MDPQWSDRAHEIMLDGARHRRRATEVAELYGQHTAETGQPFEYATGRGRMDLCVRYRGKSLAIEIKVWRPKAADPLAKGLEQLDGYLARLGLDSGWLVIFDRREKAPPLAERLGSTEATTPSGRRVVVVRA